MKITTYGKDLFVCDITQGDIEESKNVLTTAEQNNTLQRLTIDWQIVAYLTRGKIAMLEQDPYETRQYLHRAYQMALNTPQLPFLIENVNKFIDKYWDYYDFPLRAIWEIRDEEEMEQTYSH